MESQGSSSSAGLGLGSAEHGSALDAAFETCPADMWALSGILLKDGLFGFMFVLGCIRLP